MSNRSNRNAAHVNNNDAKYVFRLQSESEEHDLKNALNHWDESCMFGDKQIDAIESSNEHSLNQPTSIPSPFARIALVKTAFGEVAKYGEKALKSYHKIVSDTLDVAEIFFTFDKWNNKIEIVKWNKEEDLTRLEAGHKQLHKTLKTFLESDAAAYNFDSMRAIYILKYRDTGEMIGATSPCTLFFSSANDLRRVDIQLNATHRAFDGIVPLHKRSWDFQKYLYTWLKAYNEPNRTDGRKLIFDEVHNYLQKQKELSDRSAELENLPDTVDTGICTQLRSPDVEVLGKPLYQLKSATGPGYFTADDLLENRLIRLPYEIRKESFFNGNLPSNSRQSFLLPVKDRFFQHYSVEDLKKFIRINYSGDVAEVVLKINGQEYRKEYKKSDATMIEPSGFDCAIFPNVKFTEDKDAHYRFGLVCDFAEKDKFHVEFIKKAGMNTEQIRKRESVRNEIYASNKQLKNYSLEGSNFDYVKIKYGEIEGIVVPECKTKNGEKIYLFAIDFGTTNTHIEYKIQGKLEIKSFDISRGETDERQIHWLHGGEDPLKYVFDEEFTPAYTDSEFRFPTRTALSFGQNTEWINVYPFEKASFAALYEKRFSSRYNTILTDLKWSDGENNQKQVEAYIHSLMYLLRNKVIIGNGSLSDTKITWFYPVAMEKSRYDNLKKIWESAYEKYFGGGIKNVISITESVAPFKYFVRDRNASNLVTIDIGGGTTDIVISATGEVDYITSFRFAANSVFGDGYAENNRVKNGIVRQFSTEIKTALQTSINENDELFSIFDDMMNNRSSSDSASFLFSLGQNKKVHEAGEQLAKNVSLSKKLTDDTSQKITFVFFYAAIIYHLAKLMRAKKLQMPDKIVFSGNGSRIISLLTEDADMLKRFTKLIFMKVYEKNTYHNNDLEIILNRENPKEATCKGGLFVDNIESFHDIYMKKVVLHSNGTDSVIQRNADINVNQTDTYSAVNKDYLDKTVEETEKFVQFVFDLLPFFSNEGYRLNADSVNIARQVCSKHLNTHVTNGWNLKKKSVTDEEIIEETLFFYPLVGMFRELIDAICDKNLSNLS
ncbi:MAG: cell division FtsA domain-containing protein [Prevotellaceae bacterium]|jgi:ribosomal protein L25 (general stress protein Ctc)|nr:cell division FtsA domain-containing protein [Prevotellaceae bacterium]